MQDQKSERYIIEESMDSDRLEKGLKSIMNKNIYGPCYSPCSGFWSLPLPNKFHFDLKAVKQEETM